MKRKHFQKGTHHDLRGKKSWFFFSLFTGEIWCFHKENESQVNEFQRFQGYSTAIFGVCVCRILFKNRHVGRENIFGGEQFRQNAHCINEGIQAANGTGTFEYISFHLKERLFIFKWKSEAWKKIYRLSNGLLIDFHGSLILK